MVNKQSNKIGYYKRTDLYINPANPKESVYTKLPRNIGDNLSVDTSYDNVVTGYWFFDDTLVDMEYHSIWCFTYIPAKSVPKAMKKALANIDPYSNYGKPKEIGNGK